MEEAKKLKTVACYDKECDRFSDLSDELVCHILSFLPTKVAYRTSVLSRRWTSICTKILDLDFKIPELSPSKEIESVYAVLLRRTENIRKLSLYSYRGCQPCDVHLWVSKALDLKVQELHLELLIKNRPILLPLRLSKSESLVVLKLHGKIQPTLNSSFDIYLPSLKILHLHSYEFNYNKDGSEYDLLGLLSGCPRLEEFLLYACLKQPINISFHFLKRLHLSLFKHHSPVVEPLQINVPSSLEVLDIKDASLKKYEFMNLSNVDRATLCISKYPDFNSLYTLLKGLSNIKSLTLTSETIEFLSKENNLNNLSLLTFHKLSSLSVEISSNCSWNMLVSFLQNAPKLKDLIIEKKFKRNLRRKEIGNSRWVGPSVTPASLSTSLVTFEFKGIQNIKAELDFTRYILYRSSKLEKVKIFIQKKSKKSVEKSLLKASKKSSTLVWDINSI